MTKWDQHRHPALVLLFWGFPQFITHNLLPILLQKPKADTTPALHLLVIRFCWPLYSLSFNFLSSTSYLIPAYQNEVRDDCVHWLCLSAWVIHGNGKVQTGAVGGQGFLLFSLLDAFFLKSLTGPKLKKKRPKCLIVIFSPPFTLKQSLLCSFAACAQEQHSHHAPNIKELQSHRGDVT